MVYKLAKEAASSVIVGDDTVLRDVIRVTYVASWLKLTKRSSDVESPASWERFISLELQNYDVTAVVSFTFPDPRPPCHAALSIFRYDDVTCGRRRMFASLY